MNTHSLSTCLYITILVLVLVVGMPMIDIIFCRKNRLNPVGGKNRTVESKHKYVIRKVFLLVVFAVYMTGFLYVTFFSRHAANDYLVHVDLFKNLANSVNADFGLLGWTFSKLTGNAAALPSDVLTANSGGVMEVYLNIMLFIPMGYLLPYIFSWFRRETAARSVLVSFLSSLLVENIQLITKCGYYDIDDIITNTAGGLFGALLFLAFAFRVTHPDWKNQRKRYRRWKKNAKERTLYPFARKMSFSRTVLKATDESLIWDFYVMKLGFRLKGQMVPENEDGTVFLLELGNYQLEIECSNKKEDPGEQKLIISVTKPDKVRERLKNNGIQVSPYETDPFTGMNSFRFEAPDGVSVVMLAQNE